jgi:hypothetical protein
MSGKLAALPRWLRRSGLRRYGLAVACVIAPLALALGSFNGVLNWLAPAVGPKISFEYVWAKPPPIVSKESAARSDAPAAEATPSGSKGTTPGPGLAAAYTTPALKPAAPITSVQSDGDVRSAGPYLRALQYRGEARYAAASAFIYLASAAVFVFSLVIVYRRCGGACSYAAFMIFLGLGNVIAFGFPKPRGRELIVENLLNQAERVSAMKLDDAPASSTGDMVSLLVSANTIIALVPVGMLLVALAAISVRNVPRKIYPAELTLRRNYLRVALGLGSTLFVIGVLANKILVDWPLSLLSAGQQADLQPIADTVTLQLGTMGTIAIIAAFAPAITAWWLDVQVYRDGIARKENTTKGKDRPPNAVRPADLAPAPQPAGGTAVSEGQPAKREPADDFAFAPLSLISGIVAALAPLLASPVVDTLKSVLLAFGGGK